MKQIDTSKNSVIIVLTGAGISAESGVQTFRGIGGVWNNHDVEELASRNGFESDPGLVWRFYSERRRKLLNVKPNISHILLKRLEEKISTDNFLLVTQNVDDLHNVAGSKNVVELHGNIWKSRCSECGADDVSDIDEWHGHRDWLPKCNVCSSLMRPGVVWFGESLDYREITKFYSFLKRIKENQTVTFLAVGTSGVVYPAAGYVDQLKAIGARTVCISLEHPENAGAFDDVYIGKSSQILTQLLDV